MSVKPSEVRQARAFLQQRKITSDVVPPRALATAAEKKKRSFSDTLLLLAYFKMGGQGLGQAAKRRLAKLLHNFQPPLLTIAEEEIRGRGQELKDNEGIA